MRRYSIGLQELIPGVPILREISDHAGVYVQWQDCVQLEQQLIKVQASYSELIMAVEKKYPGESRHATALRYIQEAERHEPGPPQEEQP